MSMVTTVQEALDVARNGADIIVAQGAEAGGHRSTFNIPLENENETLPLIGTMTLVPQIVDALSRIEDNKSYVLVIVIARKNFEHNENIL